MKARKKTRGGSQERSSTDLENEGIQNHTWPHETFLVFSLIQQGLVKELCSEKNTFIRAKYVDEAQRKGPSIDVEGPSHSQFLLLMYLVFEFLNDESSDIT